MKSKGKIEIQQMAMAPPGAAKLLNLKWDNRDKVVNMRSFEFYLQNDFTDCLLSAEGNYLACHQIVLATSSPYFDNIFRSKLCGQNPVLIFNDLKFDDIVAAMTYVYTGEVKVPENRIVSLTNAMVALQIPNAKDFNDYSKSRYGEEIKSEAMSVNGDKSLNETEMQATDFLKIKHDVETPSDDKDIVVLADFLLENDLLTNQSFAPETTITPVLADKTKLLEVQLDNETATGSSPTLTDGTNKISSEKPESDELEDDSHRETLKTVEQTSTMKPTVTDAPTNISDDEDNSRQINQIDIRAKKIKKEKLQVTRCRRPSRAGNRSEPQATALSGIAKRKTKKQKPAAEPLDAEDSEIEEQCTTSDQGDNSPKTKKRKLTAEATDPEMDLDDSEEAKPEPEVELKPEAEAKPEAKVRRCKYCGIAIDGSPSTVKQERKKHQKVCPDNPRLQLTNCPFCQLELTSLELNSHVEAEHGMYA